MTIANATFSEIITFERLSAGTFVGSNGVLQSAANNIPRFDYNPTTLAAQGFLIEEARTNLVTYSEQFDNAAWTKTGSSITPDAITAPDGALSADRLVENTANSIHSMSQSFSATTGTAVTLSVYVKSTERFAVLGFGPNATFGGSGATGFFNISSGTVQNTAGPVTALITAAGNGWYRCSITSTPTATGTATASVGLSLTGVAQTYTGDGTSGLHFWGAQLEAGAFPTSYIPTTPTFVSRATTGTFVDSSGLIATAAINVARNTYNPANLTAAPFLLLEAAATNLVTYSQDFTQAAWATTNSTKTTGISDPAGGVTAATITATGTNGILQNGNATVVIGTTYTVSIWMRRRTGTGVVGIRAVENANIPVTITSTWARYSLTVTATQTAGRVGAYCSTIGDEIDIWGGQLETGTYPTSYIPTPTGAVTRAADVSTSAAVTRAADVASINTLSPWYNATEGTLYAKYVASNTAQNNGAVALSDGTNNNRMVIRATTSAAQTIFLGIVSNNNEWTGIVTSALVNTVTNSAFAYKLNDVVWVRNGGTVGIDAPPANIPAVTQLKLGADGNGALQLNGYLQKVIYYPKRLTNSEIQALTS
jgi:hypothetical protein